MHFEIITRQYPKMLKHLAQFLDRAAAFADAKKIDVDVLLNSRLAPDQFNLIKQVQIACDVAKFAPARLTGKSAPSHEDNEKTLPELKARIQSTIAYLETFQAKDFDGGSERRVTQPRWEGKTISGQEYFEQWSLPNLYFHITTAYSILRHNGVDLGKKNFLGEMPFRAN